MTALFLVASWAAAETHVLLVHSYHPEFSWTWQVDRGIHDTLNSLEMEIHIHTEYLDTKRHDPETVSELFLDLLAAKYADSPPSALIVTDNNAFDLMRARGQVLFPGVPLFFAGVNNYEDSFGTPDEGITGVAEEVDYTANLHLISRLHPEAQRVVSVSGEAITAQINLAAFREAAGGFSGRFRFEDWHGIPMAQILERLRTLDANSVVINLGLFRDIEGETFEVAQSSRLIAEASPVPVYTNWDFMVVGGVLGGVVVDGYLHGVAVSRQVIRYLQGTPISNIPVETDPTTRGVFEHDALERFGINGAQLPPGSLIRGEPETIYHEYKGLFWLGVGTIAILLFFVMILVLNTRRRIAAEQTLRASLQEKNVLIQEIHHRVKNNLQIVSSLLSLQLGHFDADSIPHAALEDSRNRILTMAHVHELLYGGESLGTVSARDYLTGIAQRIAHISQNRPEELKLLIEVEDLCLTMDEAIPVGLIVNELVSNSVKHAFPDSGGGTIRVGLTKHQEAYRLSVEDTGCGFHFDDAKSRSMGLQLVIALTDQLRGDLHFENGAGSRFDITLARGTTASR